MTLDWPLSDEDRADIDEELAQLREQREHLLEAPLLKLDRWQERRAESLLRNQQEIDRLERLRAGVSA